MTRAACGSVETRERSSGSIVSPATSRCTGSIPGSRAASGRASPSTANSPVSSLYFRCPSSLRTSLSVSLSREVITRETVSQAPIEPVAMEVEVRGEARLSGPDAQLELVVIVALALALVVPPRRDPGKRAAVVSSGLEGAAQLHRRVHPEIARRRRLENDGDRIRGTL